jgi:hypothetical protein
MTWNYYQDMGEEEPVKPQIKPKPKDDYSALIMLGLGLLGGYLLFSKEDEEKKDPKPLDNLDKAVANKIEIHGNPNILVGGGEDRLSPSDVDSFEIIHKENPHEYMAKVNSWLNEDFFSRLYNKYNGHYYLIARELLGGDYARLGHYLRTSAKDWIHKYPRKDKIKYGPVHDQNRLLWDTYKKMKEKFGENRLQIVYDYDYDKKADYTSFAKMKEESAQESLDNKLRFDYDIKNPDNVHVIVIEVAAKNNPIKDPKGGLTAEGRRHFKETEGANLKAGVTKVETLEDLKRWGQWARRFFGRSVLPPLKNEKGEPTRLALDAQAWGCKIPKTIKEAKVIAKRGTEALRYYKELKKQGLKKNDSVRFKICHD